MAASGYYKDWGPVSLGGTAITGIKSLSYDEQIGTTEDGGDFDLGMTVSGVTTINPMFRVTTNKAGMLLSMLAGTLGILIATMRDFYGGATVGDGAKVFTTNGFSYLAGREITGGHREIANATLMIKTRWADSVTHPVSVTTL
jgi:hypothetical protein